MIFTEAIFPIFLGLVLVIYWGLLRGEWRNRWLLLASAVFYGWWDVRLLGLIGAVILVSWLAARLMAARLDDRKSVLRILWVAIGFQLVVLGLFKYFGFFSDSAANLISSMGWTTSWPVLNIILPVGISFYIFQAISYLIDVFRKDLVAEDKLERVALYIAFFPQLVAGPIVRAASFFPQIARKKTLSSALVASGAKAFIIGFIYKAALADNIAPFVDPVFADVGAWSNTSLVAATFAFGTQIYFDFAGYSLMAIGVARWFGFYIPKNFNDPYSSTSIDIFWRRWHISLSSWLRDYLYIPLGGNRLGELKTYRNQMVTMLLGGLWHGAAWNFVIWGALHGMGLAIHRLVMGGQKRRNLVPVLGGVFGLIATLVFVFLTWVPFRAETLGDSLAVWRSALGLREGGGNELSWVAYCVPFFLLIDSCFSQLKGFKVLAKSPVFRNPAVYWAGLGSLAALALALYPLEAAPFQYFQF